MSHPVSSELLGHAPDDRVLIINCDDLGLNEQVNEGVLRAVQHGVASSCSLMVPCPAAAHAMQLLHAETTVRFGVHLTLVRDTIRHQWRPVSPADRVPSLVDDAGLFFTHSAAPQLLAQARIDDVEQELRAQIDVVKRAGLAPTHLDWHAVADGGRPDILDLTVELAAEYGLAGRVWLPSGRRAMRSRGLPVVDHDFVDSFSMDHGDEKGKRYVAMLRALPVGLSEWAVHPAAYEPDPVDHETAVRRSDLDFLMSTVARDVIREEGIIVIDYQGLQRHWRRVLSR